MNKQFKCILCRKNPKIFNGFDRNDIIIHHRDDHQGNLMFLDDEQLKMMIEVVEDE